VCVERGIPTPTIHGCITSDRDLALYGVARVSRGADLQRAVEPHEGQRLLLKPQHGIFGTGVHRITMIGDRVVHDDGTAETCDAFIERFVSEATPYLIQELVEPHERLRPILASGALGTFRIVTVLRGGRASIVGACLKIPRGSNVADNFQNGTTGNLLAGVDIESGRLLHIVGPRPGDVRVPVVLDTHPDTGARVTGFEIPQWNALCEMTRRAAEQIPGLVTGGWDVAVSSGGPTVIEANWRYNIYILQIANQSGVRQSLMSALQSALTAHA
jgi:glutathione synthase/RimK-type ligase-like ATP-grasp enzyme